MRVFETEVMYSNIYICYRASRAHSLGACIRRLSSVPRGRRSAVHLGPAQRAEQRIYDDVASLVESEHHGVVGLNDAALVVLQNSREVVSPQAAVEKKHGKLHLLVCRVWVERLQAPSAKSCLDVYECFFEWFHRQKYHVSKWPS
jgi:hypothetical protein